MGSHASGEGYPSWEEAYQAKTELMGYLKELKKAGQLDHYEILQSRIQYNPTDKQYYVEIEVE